MDSEVELALREFAEAVVARDRERLRSRLAPWIDADSAFAAIESHCEGLRDEWEAPPHTWPSEFSMSSGALGYEELREPSDWPPGKDIPSEVTAENFVSWNVVTGLPAENDPDVEFDAWFDAWVAVVNTADGLRVGSLEVVDGD